MSKIIYEPNQKINGLTYLFDVEPYMRKVRRAKFRCYCGNEFETSISKVKNGHTRSCGCLQKTTYLPNQKINNLTFLYEIEPHIQPNGERVRKARFRCYCGNEFETTISRVRNGHTKSCGCYNIQRIKERMTTHGLTKNKPYRVYRGMVARCYNPNVHNYSRYGGRGIKVCDEWKNDITKFFEWALQNGYREGLQIDRINNDGDYEPDNCRFVTSLVNNRNRPSTKLTIEKAREIRRLRKERPELSHRGLAKMFNVEHSTIGKLLKNKIWKENTQQI